MSLIKDEFELEPRGTVAIKGKGDIETWFLVGRRDSGLIGTTPPA